MKNTFNPAKLENAAARWRLYLAIPAILAFLAFLPTLKAGFVWDDTSVWSEQVPRIRTLRDAFIPSRNIPNFSYVYYRPLIWVSYMAESGVMGPATSGMGGLDQTKARLPHATTVFFHALASALVGLFAFGFTREFKRGAVGALVAGAVFAVNPIHSESVGFIAGRSDVLAATFLLAGLHFARGWGETGRLPKLFAFAACYFCALLSKETAIAVVLFLPLLFLAQPRDFGKQWIPLSGAVLLPLAFYFFLRHFAGLAPVEGGMFGAGETLARIFGALGFYLQNLVWPWPITPYVPSIPSAGWGLAGLAVCAVLLAYAMVKKNWSTALGLAWVLVFLLPALGVSAISRQPIAERHLYLPSVGLSVLIGVLYCSTGVAEKMKVGFCAALIIVMGSSTFYASKTWVSDVIFWSSVVRERPAKDYPIPWINLGTASLNAGDLDTAEAAYRSALAAPNTTSSEDLGKIQQSISGVELKRGQYAATAGRGDEALRCFGEAVESARSALRFAPREWRVFNSLAYAQISLYEAQVNFGNGGDPGIIESARRLLMESKKLNPQAVDTRILEGMLRR